MRLDLPDLGPLQVERADALPPPDAALLGRLKGLQQVAVLDSAAGGRYTLVAAAPLVRMRWRPGRGEILLPGGPRAREDDLFALLRAALAKTHRPGAPLPFGPGWIGYLGYGARVAVEDVPERHDDDHGLPDVAFAYYPAVAVFDADERTWWFLWRTGFADTIRTMRACFRHAGPAPQGVVDGPAQPRITRDAYLAAVARAVEYIHAGDVFQVNYAHEFTAGFRGDPLALYLKLRAKNPAPYNAYLDLGREGAICSTSPELFLTLRGREAVTRPIKGTRPRGADAAADARFIDALRRSPKDAAELAMIVDLERNDLGRVCVPGSVVVTEAARIESYATVHHRVAEVRGQLEEGFDRVDLLRAAFPGGSITGAPKVRAMEIIDELEVSRRGPYTGSIGILADDGSMDFNIAIRTPFLAGGRVRVHVGGGIVADSEPEAEYEETLAKGKAIFEALGA